MSTSQRAVMLCGWGVKAGMACLQVKLCVAISERCRKYTWLFKGALQMSRFTLLTLLTSNRHKVRKKTAYKIKMDGVKLKINTVSHLV